MNSHVVVVEWTSLLNFERGCAFAGCINRQSSAPEALRSNAEDCIFSPAQVPLLEDPRISRRWPDVWSALPNITAGFGAWLILAGGTHGKRTGTWNCGIVPKEQVSDGIQR